jgi:hypothetical protein
MLLRRWLRRRKQFDVRAQTRDIIFNLEQLGMGSVARERVEEDASKRFGKALKKRKNFSGITLRMLHMAVSELMFALWFLAMTPILKRVAVVWWGIMRG